MFKFGGFMTSIKFKCEIITPMFIGGADGKSADLRPPSIKGALRFWWRSVNSNISLKDLKNKEAEIFGGTEETQGKSKFSINVKHNLTSITRPLPPERKVDDFVRGRNVKINILEYLAYGTYYWRNGKPIIDKEYYPPEGDFFVSINIFDTIYANDILKSFRLLSNFGGLGAKSRNGYGNFVITEIQSDRFNNKIKDGFEIKDIIVNFKDYEDIPIFTSFSKHTKLFKYSSLCDSWDDCLFYLGKIYRESRLSLEKHVYEKRQYIGAPIQDSILTRRAKPYFLHVNKIDKKYQGYILYLPSDYCHGKEKDQYDKKLDSTRHEEMNDKFSEVCTEFNNSLLINGMEEVV
jgi:CRISPR-associated protein Cmr1